MTGLSHLHHWEGNLDNLVDTANHHLPNVLPDRDRTGRVKDDVNARLIRHYTTQGFLDEPLKAGREARYTARHLLQLLALRKLMTEGHGAEAAGNLLRGKTNEELQALLTGHARVQATTSNPALDYLLNLQAKRSAASREEFPAPSAPPPVPAPPPPARWTRLDIEHGLELHVRDDYRPPRTPAERDRLAREIADHLAQIRRK